MRPVIVARTWRGKFARQIAARSVMTPAQQRRAAIIQNTSQTSPAALTGDSAIRMAQPEQAAISADTQRVLWRPWARFANVRLAALAKAGAPATMATARLTSAGAATWSKPVLTITPSRPPSSAPRVTAMSALTCTSRGISVRATNGRLREGRDKGFRASVSAGDCGMGAYWRGLNPAQLKPYDTLPMSTIILKGNDMRNSITILLAAMAAAFVLTACQSEDNGSDKRSEVEEAGQAVEEAAEESAEAAEEVYKDTMESASDAAEDAGESAEDMIGAAQSEAQKAWQEALQLANEANMKARSMMNSGMERGSEAWDEAMQETRETREQAQQALEDAREYSGEQWDSFSARVQAVMDEASRAWSDLTEDGESGSDADDSGNA